MSKALKVGLDGGPYALAAGPDGAMWVTLAHSGEIARVTETGEVAVYPVAPQARPSIIAAGPDGAMWFTRAGDDRIGRITSTVSLLNSNWPRAARRSASPRAPTTRCGSPR